MYCGRKRAFSDLEIDHKTPVQRGGSDNVRNLQVLCPPCNKRKGNQTGREFRRRYRDLLPKTQRPPEPAIRQDEFDMVTATTNRPRHARTGQPTRASTRTPPTVESLTIDRETGFFSDAIKLSWPAPDTDEPITGYRLQFRVVAGGPDTGWLDFTNPHQGNFPRFEANNVPQSKRFAFRVRARNEAGWGQWSQPFSEVGPEGAGTKEERKLAQAGTASRTEPEEHPLKSVTQASFERIPGIFTDAVIARWPIPETTVGLVIGYEVQFRLHQGQGTREWTYPSPRHDGREPSYRFNNVPKPGINQFSIRVRAKNDAGWGPWSQEMPDTSA